MNMHKHDESRRKAVIHGRHGNHTKPHALTMATEPVEEVIAADDVGAGFWLFEVIHARQLHSISK